MTRDHAIDAAGASGGEPPPPDPIDAELADHLALVEREIVFSGARADEANELARQRFGDIDRVRRQCQWVQEGDAIMLRYTMSAAFTAISIALAVTAWSSWRGQQQLASQLEAMSDSMAAKMESISSALVEMERLKTPAPTTGSISGYAYFGNKETPAAGATLQILRRLPSDRGWETDREIAVGEDGRFKFEALTPAIYSVYSELGANNVTAAAEPTAFIQSEPRPVGPGDVITDLDLDLRLHAGCVRIGLSRELPASAPHLETALPWQQFYLSLVGHVRFESGLPVRRRNANGVMTAPNHNDGPWTPWVTEEHSTWPLVHPFHWNDGRFNIPWSDESDMVGILLRNAPLYADYPFGWGDKPAPWLVGDYSAEFAISAIGLGQDVLSAANPHRTAEAAFPLERTSPSTAQVPIENLAINGARLLDRKRVIRFQVRENEVTDLIVQIPDDIDELRRRLVGLLEEWEFPNDREVVHIGEAIKTRDQYERFMDIMLRWFDVKVVGPRPLAEVEAEIAAGTVK